MKKVDYLNELRKRLTGLPQEDIDDRVSFYGEMIDDRIEEGLSEEEAIESIGSIESIIAQTMSETPLTKLVKEKIRPKRDLKAWEIILLVLGAPLWIPVVLGAIICILALYFTIWVFIASVYVVDLCLAGSVFASLAGIFVYLKSLNVAGALFAFGSGLAMAGLAIILLIGCIWLTKCLIRFTGSGLLGVKTSFVGKEA